MPKAGQLALIESARSLAPDRELSPNGTYEPISSVWEGSDGDLLEAMFNFYASIPPGPILDATFNAGRFWKGSKRDVLSMDIDPQYTPSIDWDNPRTGRGPSRRFGVRLCPPVPVERSGSRKT